MYDTLTRWLPRALVLLTLGVVVLMGVVILGPTVRTLLSPTVTWEATVSDKKIVRPSTVRERAPGSREVHKTVFATPQGSYLSVTRSVYDDLVIGDMVELDVATATDKITTIRSDGEEVYRHNPWWSFAIFTPIAVGALLLSLGIAWVARWMLRWASRQQARADAHMWDPPSEAGWR